MKKHLSMIAAAYKLIWVRVSCYFLIPFIAAFLALTELYTGPQWDELHWFIKTRILLNAFISGVTPLIAFIDQSLGRASAEYDKRKQESRTERSSDPTVPTP